jgi:hypothetical protein
MYSENAKAVLALYSLFIIVIICVLFSSFKSSPVDDFEVASTNNINKFDVIRTYSSITLCECVEYAYDYAHAPLAHPPAGWDTSTSEYCAVKYPHIQYVYVDETLDDYATSTWATSPQCPEWRGVQYR